MSDDLATIKDNDRNDPEGLAVSLSGPVALDRKPVYPIRNYGSAMAPFYTILSLLGRLDCTGGHDEGVG